MTRPGRATISARQRFLVLGGLVAAVAVGLLVNPAVLDGKGLLLASTAVIGAAFLVFLVESTEWAVLFLLAGRASLDLVATQRIGPLNVAAVLGLLVIAAAVLHMWGTRSFPGPKSPVFPYALFLGAAALSLVDSPDRLGGVKDLFRFMSLLAVFVLVGVIGRTERGMRRVLVAIAVSSVLPVLFALVQFTTGAGMTIKQGEFVRVVGTFLHPNPFALYLAMILPVLIAAAVTVREWRRWLTVLVAGLLICMLLTFTRTGWIGLLAAVLMMAFLRYRKALLLVPIVLAAVLFLIPGVADRFADLGSPESPTGSTTNSLDWRFQYWQEALQSVGGSPIWGQGLSYIRETTEEGKEAHNDFVRIVVETGLLGLALFVWAVVRLVRRSAVAVGQRASPLRHAVRVAFAGTLVGYLVMSLTSNLISQPAVQWYFWSIMALALCDVDAEADGGAGLESVPDTVPAQGVAA